MTKKELKKQMIDLIDYLYEREDNAKDEQTKRDLRCQVAGIDRLSIALNIKLWD